MKIFTHCIALLVSCVAIVYLIHFYFGLVPAYTAVAFLIFCVTPDIVSHIFEDYGWK